MSDDVDVDAELDAMSMRCPVCARAASDIYGPRFKARRLIRRTAFWCCSWCKYRCTDLELPRDCMPIDAPFPGNTDDRSDD